MTMNSLWSRLRKKNKKDYRQFQFCILFAMMLVSSYLMLMFSPLIQKALPEGGDSGKQVYMIFAIAVVGCTVFVWYAARLFLRYKSREIGIFMALGAEKSMLSGSLQAELFKLLCIYALEGIAAGAAVAFLGGKVIEQATKSVQDYRFAYSVQGLLASVAYGLVLFLFIAALAQKAMKRTDIMAVINEQRKQEPFRKTVTKRYFTVGVILIFTGIFMGYFVPQFAGRVLGIFLGGVMNLFYGLTALGIYRVLVYSVSSRRRGRNPQKYYNHLLNYGMMKFQGASVVRNMLVIVLLVLGGMYSLCYIPQMGFAAFEQEQSYEDEYSFRYLQNARGLTKERIELLAQEYQVEIQDYREGEFIRIKGSGVNRDSNEQGLLTEEYYDDYAEYDCTSAAEYEKLTGIHLEIPKGSYYLICNKGTMENIWFRFGDMDKLYREAEDNYLPVKYLGNTEYQALAITPGSGLGEASRFVLNNEDYQQLREGLPAKALETQLLFNTRDSGREGSFAKALYREFALNISPEMDVMDYYNACEAERRGEDYAYKTGEAVFDPDLPAKETDWQFKPVLAPLLRESNIMGMAVRFLLFLYVSVICFAAAGIIGYTRSQSVCISNEQLFRDIEKLGADRTYCRWLLKKQVAKVYVLPTVIGVALALFYEISILYGNDGHMMNAEYKTLAAALALGSLAALYQGVMYRKSLKQAARLLKLDKE